MKKNISISIVIVFSFACLLCGCEKKEVINTATPYQVILLDNNTTYLGKVQQTGKEFLRLDNVFYIQNHIDPETKQAVHSLVRRGNEPHRPDCMYINMQHVVLIEPVTPDSQVAKLIEQSVSENGKKTEVKDVDNK